MDSMRNFSSSKPTLQTIITWQGRVLLTCYTSSCYLFETGDTKHGNSSQRRLGNSRNWDYQLLSWGRTSHFSVQGAPFLLTLFHKDSFGVRHCFGQVLTSPDLSGSPLMRANMLFYLRKNKARIILSYQPVLVGTNRMYSVQPIILVK